MYRTGPHVHSGTVEHTCNELGVQPPPPYLAAVATADRLKAALGEISQPDTATKLSAAVFTCLLADKDPLADKSVQRLVMLQQLQSNGIHPAADDHRRNMIGDAVCQYADDFVAAWAAATVGDGEILRTTAQSDVFANVQVLQDMRPAELSDPADHRQWVNAATAARRLDAAAQGFTALLAATHLSYRPEHRVLALAPDLTLTELASVNRANRQTADAWTLARAGHTARLAGSLGEFIEAVGRLGAEQSERAEAARAIVNEAGFDGPTPEQRRRYNELTRLQ